MKATWAMAATATLHCLTGCAISLVVAFVVTTPVNRWMISKGRGHAVVHAHHGH